VDLEVTPPPSDDERRAIAAALAEADTAPAVYASPWRAAALEDSGDDPLAQQGGSDTRVVEP
jgi:hypothetical protein